jgi:predicted dehydrogenase/SAM-dependent methyltransferase
VLINTPSRAEWDTPSLLQDLWDPLDGSKLRFEPLDYGEEELGLLIGQTHTWPVVDAIPMLRTGRQELCKAVCREVQQADRVGALRLLLNDRDDFDGQPPALISQLDAVIASLAATDQLLGESLYLQMRRLNFGPVADYFAVRPFTPTFISGLELFAQSAGHCDALIDLGCGIGQLAGWLQRRLDIPVMGIDTVFSKLWLARYSYLPNAPLLCCDICRDALPLKPNQSLSTAVMCHDVFYFFQDKRTVLKKATQLAGSTGVVLLGHVHTDRDPHPVGHPQSIADYGSLFCEFSERPWVVVDDDALARAAMQRQPAPFQADFSGLQQSAAISVCLGNGQPCATDVQVLKGAYRPNPALVFTGDRVHVSWPSAALANEYRSTDYLCTSNLAQLTASERRRRRIELPADYVIPTEARDAINVNVNADAKDRVRWAVVGCGWVARDYGIPAILDARNGFLTTCIDADTRAITKLREKLPAAVRETLVLDDAITQETLANVDAVYVATPNHTHAAVVAKLASLKKHVLCEKPMTTTVAEAKALIAAVENNHIHYATALDQRHHPAHITLRDLIQRGRIGKVTQLRIHYACWLPRTWSPDHISQDNWRVDFGRSGGGATIDLAAHGIDLVEFLTGDQVDWINVRLQRRVHDYDRCDDGGVVLVQTRSGILASLHLSYACPDALPRRRLEIIGSRGLLQATNTMGQTAGGTLALVDEQGRREIISFADEGVTPFHNQIASFGDVLLQRRQAWNSPQKELYTHSLFLNALQEAYIHLASALGRGDTPCLS